MIDPSTGTDLHPLFREHKERLRREAEKLARRQAGKELHERILKRTAPPWAASTVVEAAATAAVPQPDPDPSVPFEHMEADDSFSLHAELEEKERYLRRAKAVLDSRERSVQEQELLLSMRENYLQEKAELIALREKALHEKLSYNTSTSVLQGAGTGAVSDLSPEEDQSFNRLREALEKREKSLEEREKMLREREAFVEESETTLFEKAQELQEREEELASLRDELEIRKQKLDLREGMEIKRERL